MNREEYDKQLAALKKHWRQCTALTAKARKDGAPAKTIAALERAEYETYQKLVAHESRKPR